MMFEISCVHVVHCELHACLFLTLKCNVAFLCRGLCVQRWWGIHNNSFFRIWILHSERHGSCTWKNKVLIMESMNRVILHLKTQVLIMESINRVILHLKTQVFWIVESVNRVILHLKGEVLIMESVNWVILHLKRQVLNWVMYTTMQ